MIPFRISVSLNSFFNDQRSLSYILIDNRFQTIEDLENHIKIVFKLKPDCDICLISNNHLLPSTEEINLIHEGDSLHVSPVNKDFCLRTNPNVITEADLQPPTKKRKSSKKHLNTACISIDDSSDEKDILKIESETVPQPQPSKKKKKKKSVQFGETFSNDNQKTESNETVVMEVDNIDQRNVIDNKNIQILNIENVSNMQLDSMNRTNLDSKIDENELLFCTTEVSTSNYYKNEASSSKTDRLQTISKFNNTAYSASNIDNTASQCFDSGTSSKFSNIECTISKNGKNRTITSQQFELETSSKFCDTENLKYNISTSQRIDSPTPKLCNTKKNSLETTLINSKFDIESTSKIIGGVNDLIKNDNSTNINENESITKDGETSNEFIEHLRISHNGSRGKIPPFTVGDFLNYANSVGNKRETKIGNNNMNSPSTIFVTKRRKRVRKRKSRSKDGNSSINSMSDVEQEFRRPLKIESPRIHIRFDNLDKNSNETTLSATSSPMCSSTPNQESTTKCIIKKDKSETIVNGIDRNSIKENSTTESKMEITRNSLKKISSLDVNDHFFKNIDLADNNLENVKNVVMKKDIPPEVNDIIAFKTYELNEKYEPSISNWIVGKILKWHPTEKIVDVFILAGQIKTTVPNGRFELENNGDLDNENDRSNKSENWENEGDSNNDKSSIVHLNFLNLIDPRLVIIQN